MNERIPDAPAQPNEARTERLTGRQALRTITTVDACRDCGRVSVMPDGAVAMRRTTEGVVGLAGLKTCGRIWLCPVCNAKVMAKRAMEIGAALSWVTMENFHVIWGSLTVRHHAGSDLDELLEIQKEAWRHVVNSKQWRAVNATDTFAHGHSTSCQPGCERKRDIALSNRDGRIGYIRAAEVTIGGNGWHPHFHPIIIYRGSLEDARAFAVAVVALWVSGVSRAGGVALGHGAQQLTVLDSMVAFDNLASYVTKATYQGATSSKKFDAEKLAIETVWSQGKKGRGRAKETTAHWSLLAAVAQGLADEAVRWWELEEASAGHRMITWSRGLRQFAQLGDETTDEDEAAREIGTVADTVCFITGDGWRSVRDNPGLLGLLLDVLERSGWEALRVLLDAYGVAWEPVVSDPFEGREDERAPAYAYAGPPTTD